MKTLHFATRILIVSIVMSVLLTASSQAADHHCSNATAAGKWGFTTNGTVAGVGPVGAVGRFSQDAAGNLVGIQTRSLNGSIAEETLTGNVTVDPDCTAIATINVFESGTLVRVTTLDVVYVNNVRDAHAIFTSLVLQPSGTKLPTVVTVDLKRLFTSEED
jgi:hypothetical protein